MKDVYENGPNQSESKKILAQTAIESIQDISAIKYIWYHYDDWPKNKKRAFLKMQEQIIQRLKKWGKLEED
tara:strand:- start:126 stop:338 length:213 start_codon:yes stop_codon:yes gene_type:complete